LHGHQRDVKIFKDTQTTHHKVGQCSRAWEAKAEVVEVAEAEARIRLPLPEIIRSGIQVVKLEAETAAYHEECGNFSGDAGEGTWTEVGQVLERVGKLS